MPVSESVGLSVPPRCTHHRSTLRPASANSEYAVIMLAKAVAMVTSWLYLYLASTEEATAAVSSSTFIPMSKIVLMGTRRWYSAIFGCSRSSM